jgi:hypothetical protein
MRGVYLPSTPLAFWRPTPFVRVRSPTYLFSDLLGPVTKIRSTAVPARLELGWHGGERMHGCVGIWDSETFLCFLLTH